MRKTPLQVCSYCLEKKSYFVISQDEKSCICKDCIEKYNDIINESINRSQHMSYTPITYTPKELKKKLDEYIVGQDNAKKTLCVSVYNHYKRLEANLDDRNDIEIDKSNVLLLGPTGSGKTLIASTLAKILNIPFAIADATTLTESGYVGDDVENILLKLIQNAQYDIQKAERGIIFIDEIDKISRKGESLSITRDVSGEGVQQALLKMIEGTEASVPPQGGRKHPQNSNIKINTKDILFICGGAFIGLDEVINSRMHSNNLGFNSFNKDSKKHENLLPYTNTDDLIKFGLIPELIGRLPIVSVLEELSDTQLKDILLKPKNSIIKQYTYLLKLEGVKLTFRNDAINEIIKLSKTMKTGARGLRSIIEKTMTEIMYDIPKSNIKSVTITKENIFKISKQIITVEENIA